MKRMVALFLFCVLCVTLFGCTPTTPSTKTTPPPDTVETTPPPQNEPPAAAKDKFVIGMSQCNVGEPWRVAMNDQIKAAADQHPEFQVVFSDAQQDNSKQIADVENFITQKVDLLIISPNEATPLTDVVKRAFDSGIPVIVLDRRVDGSAFTSFIGGDNVLIGKKAGEWVAKNYPNGCNIVEIKGLEGATPQKERHDGFLEGMGSDPKYKIVFAQSCDWLRDKAITVMESALQAESKIDVVYGHNDPAAIGAYIAAENAGRQTEMKFIGIDALPTADGGIKEVMAGRLAVTYVYPTGGAEAIDAAYRLLVKGETLQKEVILDTIEVTADNAQAIYTQFGGK